MTDLSSPKRKHRFFWRKKKPAVETNIAPTFDFEHPWKDHPCAIALSPRSSATTVTTLHESGTSILTFAEEDEECSNRPPQFSVTTSPFGPVSPLANNRSSLGWSHSLIPFAPLCEEPEQRTTNDVTDSIQYAQELQEQELLELAMEMSLRDDSAEAESQQLSSELLSEEERLERLEQELLERVLRASRTDL